MISFPACYASVPTTTANYISKLYECDSTGSNTSCTRFIWAGDIRIAMVATNGTTHYWHGEHLGSSSQISAGHIIRFPRLPEFLTSTCRSGCAGMQIAPQRGDILGDPIYCLSRATGDSCSGKSAATVKVAIECTAPHLLFIGGT
jgi:hypothetical protein